MRTTLNMDGDALAEAVEASGGKTKSAVVNEALRLYAPHSGDAPRRPAWRREVGR